jgi:DNA helicase HerA-like ATPase
MDQQGAVAFFGEPMLDIHDLIQANTHGKGVINILAADVLMNTPVLYSTLLLWLLSELYEQLPEIGDPDKPVMVFFFDEAHLLFTDAPQALLEKIEQVVRLIRSKGVGVYFVTQNPLDVPPTVLGQLGNRVQHALRAFSPADQKAVKTAADTLRQNPKIDTQKVITELGVGEALISFLEEKGTPAVVDRAWVLPPSSRIGAITPAERQAVIAGSVLKGHYEQAVDRESAYEKVKARTADRTGGQAAPADTAARPTATATPPTVSFPTTKPPSSAPSGMPGSLSSVLFGTTGPRGGHHEGLLESAARSATRSMGSAVGRSIIRGVLGSILGGK